MTMMTINIANALIHIKIKTIIFINIKYFYLKIVTTRLITSFIE